MAIVDILASMTDVRPWGGAYPNAPRVVRELVQPDSVATSPTICVKEDTGSAFQAEQPLEGVGGQLTITDRLSVVIYGHVIATGDVGAGTWLLRLRDDIRRTLLANVTLGDLSRSMEFGNEEMDGGLLEPRGLFVLPITVLIDDVYTVS